MEKEVTRFGFAEPRDLLTFRVARRCSICVPGQRAIEATGVHDLLGRAVPSLERRQPYRDSRRLKDVAAVKGRADRAPKADVERQRRRSSAKLKTVASSSSKQQSDASQRRRQLAGVGAAS
jgi:hypothetical protein